MTEPATTWRKSSFSGSNNECVEVAHAVGRIALRDSKNPEDGALAVSMGEWSAFVAGAKRGEFDLA